MSINPIDGVSRTRRADSGFGLNFGNDDGFSQPQNPGQQFASGLQQMLMVLMQMLQMAAGQGAGQNGQDSSGGMPGGGGGAPGGAASPFGSGAAGAGGPQGASGPGSAGGGNPVEGLLSALTQLLQAIVPLLQAMGGRNGMSTNDAAGGLANQFGQQGLDNGQDDGQDDQDAQAA